MGLKEQLRMPWNIRTEPGFRPEGWQYPPDTRVGDTVMVIGNPGKKPMLVRFLEPIK